MFIVIKSAGDLVAGARILVFTLITLAVATLSASSAELKGLVINGTTQKPAAGDEVILLTLSDGGMGESARTNTDSTGHFSFVGAGMQSSQLVRVVHQGVTYHQMAKPGARALAIEVYDVAEKLEGVTAIMDVQRFEATSDTLEVKELVTVRNASQPPRTLSSGRGFEFRLPPQAQVQSGLVQVEEEQPLRQRPLAGEQKGRYYFVRWFGTAHRSARPAAGVSLADPGCACRVDGHGGHVRHTGNQAPAPRQVPRQRCVGQADTTSSCAMAEPP